MKYERVEAANRPAPATISVQLRAVRCVVGVMQVSDDDSRRWDDEEEFLEWIEEYCDYVVAVGESNASTHDISNALKMRGIQNDLEAGEISFEEAVERYERELVTGDEG